MHAARYRTAVLAAAGVIAATTVLAPLLAAADAYRGRRLVDVLRELRAGGLDLIFSSAVVGEELRVGIEPQAATPRALLDEILPPLGLAAEDGPGGSILILPAKRFGGVRGRVVSASGGRPIAGASVRVTGRAAMSDVAGAFALESVTLGVHEVVVEATGFATASLARVRVLAGVATELRVELTALPMYVTEVVVTPGRHSVVLEEQASRHLVTSEQAVLVPTMGGDAARVVETLPGVAAPDNSAAFHVRGSVARDVSLVLDGLELYDPFHLQSFQSPYSLVDSNLVDRIDVFGGGFTAERGDRHGGFVEISTVVPELPARGEIEVGTLNGRVSYGAPTSKRAGAWLLSGRGWYPDSWRDTSELGRDENYDPRFWDLYAKASFLAAPRHQLSLHGLVSHDRLQLTETGETVNESVDAETQNAYAWVRAVSAWSPSLTSETVLSGGLIDRQRDGISAVEEPITVDDSRLVHMIGVEHDSTWHVSNAHVLKAGADVRWLDAEYRYSNSADPEPLRIDPDGFSLAAYVAHRVRVSETLTTELGLRWDRQSYTGHNQVSPRFNAVWRPAASSELRLALGRFHQSQRIHELQVEDGETVFRRAEASEQAELSFQQGFGPNLRVRFDAYYRELSDLRPRYENLFEPIELFPETTEDRVTISPDSARLRGIEVLVQGSASEPLFWWASYGLSLAEDSIDGQDVPRSWDQTHAARFLIGYRRQERWSVSLSGSIHTGWPTTPVVAEATAPDGWVPGERNSDRFEHYARLDFKGRRAIRLPHGRLWLTLEVTNLTDRKNPCCVNDVTLVPRGDGTFDAQRDFDSWLGFTPFFSVLWAF